MDIIEDIMAELAEMGVDSSTVEVVGRRARQRWAGLRVEVRSTSTPLLSELQRAQVKTLREAGLPRRTAYRKVTGR